MAALTRVGRLLAWLLYYDRQRGRTKVNVINADMEINGGKKYR